MATTRKVTDKHLLTRIRNAAMAVGIQASLDGDDRDPVEVMGGALHGIPAQDPIAKAALTGYKQGYTVGSAE